MKRRPCGESNGADPPEEPRSAKKLREEAEAAEGEKGSAPVPVPVPVPVPELGEDAIYEVLRRADARTLAAAACVSRRWRRLAADARLWEAACVRHWEAARDYGGARLRPVVLALGGFRRLHSLYLAPLLRPPLLPLPLPSDRRLSVVLPSDCRRGGGGGVADRGGGESCAAERGGGEEVGEGRGAAFAVATLDRLLREDERGRVQGRRRRWW